MNEKLLYSILILIGLTFAVIGFSLIDIIPFGICLLIGILGAILSGGSLAFLEKVMKK